MYFFPRQWKYLLKENKKQSSCYHDKKQSHIILHSFTQFPLFSRVDIGLDYSQSRTTEKTHERNVERKFSMYRRKPRWI